jgi:hypothetical protein
VTFDFTPPGLVDGVIAVTPLVATTGHVLAIALESDEALVGPPAVEVADENPATLVDEDANAYAYTYPVSGAEGEGMVEVAATRRRCWPASRST